MEKVSYVQCEKTLYYVAMWLDMNICPLAGRRDESRALYIVVGVITRQAPTIIFSSMQCIDSCSDNVRALYWPSRCLRQGRLRRIQFDTLKYCNISLSSHGDTSVVTSQSPSVSSVILVALQRMNSTAATLPRVLDGDGATWRWPRPL